MGTCLGAVLTLGKPAPQATKFPHVSLDMAQGQGFTRQDGEQERAGDNRAEPGIQKSQGIQESRGACPKTQLSGPWLWGVSELLPVWGHLCPEGGNGGLHTF